MLNLKVNKKIADKHVIKNSLLKRMKDKEELIEFRKEELKKKSLNKMLYLSMTKLEKTLSIDSKVIEIWDRNQIIDLNKRETKTGRIKKRIRLDKLYKFCKEHSFSHEAGNILGINKETVLKWVDSGIIKACSGNKIDGNWRYLFKREGLEKLEYFNTEEVADYLDVSKRYIRKLVNKGELTAFREKYLFLKKEVKELNRKLSGYITVEELSNKLKADKDEIRNLIKNNKSAIEQTPQEGYFNKYIIKKSEIREYYNLMSSNEVAQHLEVAEVTVRKWAREGRIKAIKGPSINGEQYYKYSRLDVEKFKKRLESLRNSKGRNAQYNLLTLVQVAKKLNISQSFAWELVDKGRLKPYRGPKEDGYDIYLFRSSYIERFSSRFEDDILSAREAADILNEDLSWFYEKWVETERLNTVKHDDKLGTHFFKKEEVKEMAQMKKNTITGPEAAERLGVSRTTILKWKDKGKIKPVSGPDIDGFGNYLYLEKEVEQLKK